MPIGISLGTYPIPISSSSYPSNSKKIFQANGYLKIYLNGTKLSIPKGGISGFLAKNIGILGELKEKYSLSEFLQKSREFYKSIGIENAIYLSIDNKKLYSDNEKRPKDLEEAIRECENYISNKYSKKVLISTSGSDENFDLFLNFGYQSWHDRPWRGNENEPSMTLGVIGFPKSFLRKDKESKCPISFVDNKKLMEDNMSKYQKEIKRLFDVQKIDYSIETGFF